MTTRTEQPAAQADGSDDRARARLGRLRLLLPYLMAFSVIWPLALVAVAVLAGSWTPVGDEAVILTRIHDIGTGDTPLVGSYSTRGWSHPGPALFWMLAPVVRLVDRPEVALAATALANAAAVLALVWLARRRGGIALVILTLMMIAVLFNGLRPDTLIWFWNPYVPLLPYLIFLFAIWSIMCRDWVGIPIASLVGSVIVQLHVSYGLLVAAALALCVAFLILQSRSARGAADEIGDRPPALRRNLVIGALLAGAIWLPVLIDLLVGERNALTVARYFAGGHAGETVGPSTGFGILSREMSPIAPWSGDDEVSVLGSVQPGSLIPLALLIVALSASAFWSQSRRRLDLSVLSVLALVQLAASGLAASRLEYPALGYLVSWMFPLAVFVWISALWPIVDRGLEILRARASPGLQRGALIVAACTPGAIVFVGFVRASESWTDPATPRAYWAEAVDHTLDQVERVLEPGSTIRIEFVGDEFYEPGPGITAGLIERGFTVFTSDGADAQKWGDARVWRGQPVDDVLTVVVSPPFTRNEPIASCDRSPRVEQITSFEPLSASERDELEWLGALRFDAAGRLGGEQAARLAELENLDRRVAVFHGAEPCPAPAG